jgi:phage terminase large subunit-like protein
VLERRKTDVAPRLLDFESQGDAVLVDNPGDDVVELVDVVEQVYQSGKMPDENGIGVDQYGISEIVEEIARRNIETEKRVIGIPQGWKLTGAIKDCERRLAGKTVGKRLRHGGRPLMSWCVGNAKAVAKGSATSINKETSGSAKIDPLLATFDAVSLMALNPTAAEHDGGGVIILDAA